MYHQQQMNQSQQPQWMQPSQQQAASSQFKLTNFRSHQQPANANNYNFQAGTQTNYKPAGFVPSIYQSNTQTQSTYSGNQSWQSHMTTPQSYRQTNYRSSEPSVQNTLKRQTHSQPTITTGYTNQAQNQPQTYQPTGFVQSMMYQNNQEQHQTTTYPSTMHRTQTTAHQPQHFSSFRANQPSQASSNRPTH
ncbi:hypothetical protein VQL36_12900 [Chengkuizengella sp. SCS-71B]|uniref:hypothetical protein n=1 Tax=Chengkuizengella sp. SCS-71B TaxID=3115290 RepID=UPI0032C24145